MNKNEICVVGIGPGSAGMMTADARRVLQECSCVVGYPLYVDLVKDLIADKKTITTSMKQEEERCKAALVEAKKGEKVAFVCSGDAGVYGMAGLLYEMAEESPEIEVKVIPGITAALSGAALLGAPLIHDCCLISLSDLMTPMETIRKRLILAAEAGFIIVLYNPGSRTRRDYLKRACEWLMEELSPETVCGLARQIGREGEETQILTLSKLKDMEADMFTTVFIGNATTKEIRGKMVTPRGYAFEHADPSAKGGRQER